MNENQRTMMEEDDVIDLVELWYLFLSKLKFIVLFAVLGGLVVGVYTHFLITPMYKASSKLYMVSASSNSVINLSDLQLGSSMASDYKELILTRPMLESAIENLGLKDTSASKVKNMLSVANVSGTRILTVTATTPDPKLSMDLANEIAELAVNWLPEIMETSAPNIAEDAILPTVPSSPNLAKNALIGAVVAAVAYFAICLILYYVDDTIHTSEDFERCFGIVPLATVPEDQQQGGRK